MKRTSYPFGFSYKNLACGTLCWTSLAYGSFCFIRTSCLRRIRFHKNATVLRKEHTNACQKRVPHLILCSLQLFVSILTETVEEKRFYWPWHKPNQLGVTVTVESKNLWKNRESFSDGCTCGVSRSTQQWLSTQLMPSKYSKNGTPNMFMIAIQTILIDLILKINCIILYN